MSSRQISTLVNLVLSYSLENSEFHVSFPRFLPADALSGLCGSREPCPICRVVAHILGKVSQPTVSHISLENARACSCNFLVCHSHHISYHSKYEMGATQASILPYFHILFVLGSDMYTYISKSLSTSLERRATLLGRKNTAPKCCIWP